MKKFKHIKQKEDYDCSIAAWAMALGITYKKMVKLLGSDGSKILFEHRDSPFCYEGIYPCHCAWVALKLGYKPVNVLIHPLQEGAVEITGYPSADEVLKFMNGKKGVASVNSRRFAGAFHSVYWDGKNIHDPRCDKGNDGGNYVIRDFWWVEKDKKEREKKK